MDYKKPLTITKQIDYLKENKRVVFNSCSEIDAQFFLLKNNYINVISPFKFMFAKKDENDNPIRDINGKHIYLRDVDFNEYRNEYIKERTSYNKLFNSISTFENIFNSIISYYALTVFNICNTDKFDLFVEYMINEANNTEHYSLVQKEKMIKEISSFKSKLNKYDSPYIFFDRLTLSETTTIYRLFDYKNKKVIFKTLKSFNSTLGYPSMKQFEEALTKLIHIRNCVYHGNSLTILTRYYKVKTKELRKSSNRKKYITLINRLLKDEKTTD